MSLGRVRRMLEPASWSGTRCPPGRCEFRR